MNTSAPSEKPDAATRTSFPQRKAFVLQFSAEAGPQTGVFKGRVEHVSSGAAASFDSTDEFWAFVRAVMMRPSAVDLLSLPPARRRSA